MTTNLGYVSQAGTLLLAARMEAAKMVGRDAAFDDLVELFEAAERGARGRVHVQLNQDGDAAKVVIGGILAAHAIHARLHMAGEDELADVLARHLPALWSGDLTQRLDASRVLTTLGDASTLGLRELGTLLRRGPGDELVAASGHLTRRLVTGSRDARQGLGEAWYATFGSYILAANLAVRTAATNLVRAGRPKTSVAASAGISRTTLDAWLSAGAGGLA